MSELIKALAKALPMVGAAIKDRKNPAFKSTYADLSSVIEAIRPVAEHGLWFRQESVPGIDGTAAIETWYIHAGGEQMSAGITRLPVTKNDAQGHGSATTYARRYGLMAAFGIAPEDDDGNASVSRDPPKPQLTEPPQGWSAWALEFAAVIDGCETTDAIDRYQVTHKANLVAVKAAVPAIYVSIGKAITARKAILSPATQKAAQP